MENKQEEIRLSYSVVLSKSIEKKISNTQLLQGDDDTQQSFSQEPSPSSERDFDKYFRLLGIREPFKQRLSQERYSDRIATQYSRSSGNRFQEPRSNIVAEYSTPFPHETTADTNFVQEYFSVSQTNYNNSGFTRNLPKCQDSGLSEIFPNQNCYDSRLTGKIRRHQDEGARTLTSYQGSRFASSYQDGFASSYQDRRFGLSYQDSRFDSSYQDRRFASSYQDRRFASSYQYIRFDSSYQDSRLDSSYQDSRFYSSYQDGFASRYQDSRFPPSYQDRFPSSYQDSRFASSYQDSGFASSHQDSELIGTLPRTKGSRLAVTLPSRQDNGLAVTLPNRQGSVLAITLPSRRKCGLDITPPSDQRGILDVGGGLEEVPPRHTENNTFACAIIEGCSILDKKISTDSKHSDFQPLKYNKDPFSQIGPINNTENPVNIFVAGADKSGKFSLLKSYAKKLASIDQDYSLFWGFKAWISVADCQIFTRFHHIKELCDCVKLIDSFCGRRKCALVLVYNLKIHSTLQEIDDYIKNNKEYFTKSPVPIVLVGANCEITDLKPHSSTAFMASDIFNSHSEIKSIHKCTIKTGEKVEEIFLSAIKSALTISKLYNLF